MWKMCPNVLSERIEGRVGRLRVLLLSVERLSKYKTEQIDFFVCSHTRVRRIKDLRLFLSYAILCRMTSVSFFRPDPDVRPEIVRSPDCCFRLRVWPAARIRTVRGVDNRFDPLQEKRLSPGIPCSVRLVPPISGDSHRKTTEIRIQVQEACR